MHGDDFDPMPWALQLPSYAAVSLESRNRLSETALKDAEAFALGPYLGALVAGRQMGEEIYARIAGLVGLSEPLVQRWRGRIPLTVFTKELHRGDDALVSRYDGSVLGLDPYPSSNAARGPDPILEGLKAPITAAFLAYARDELQFKTDRRYELLSGEVNRHWQWREGDGMGYPGASDDLREGLALNPRLKGMVAHGMTDLQTPYFASRYVIDHLPGRLSQERIQLRLYEGGHMMYLRKPSRARLRADARALYGE